MARTAGRSADETKRLILDAAAGLISRHGVAVPVSDIAVAAGVSKGGLLYHFPSKEALLAGMAEDLILSFRQDVERAASQEPPGPGRLTRAYIKVCFSLGQDMGGLRDYAALAVHLMFEPTPIEMAQEDARLWREELFADGLEPSVVRLIIAATDGSSSVPLWGAVLSQDDCKELERQLIELAR